MKATTLLCAVLALGPICSLAQDSKGGQAIVDLQAAKKPEKKPPVLPPPQPTGEILGKRVVYGGYLVDYSRAEKKRPLFSLRTPNDPQKDFENLWFYPGTDRIQGVVLFSVKF